MDTKVHKTTDRRSWYDGRLNKLLKRPKDSPKPLASCPEKAKSWPKKPASHDDSDEEATLYEFSPEPENIDKISQKDVEAQVKELQQQVQIDLNNAEAARLDLKDQRGKGVRKLSANTQEFLVNFSRFIDGYSGIGEIVKAADSQFGGVAWGTLSIFLSVAVVKQEREDEINRAMVEFVRYCPRLRLLREIYPFLDLYPDLDLKRHIGEMETHIIEFARVAKEYYQKKSISRIVSSSNPNAKVTQAIQDIQAGLVNIRLDCEALMQRRIFDQSTQIEALNEKLVRMNASLERSERERHTKHISRLRNRFSLPEGLTYDLPAFKDLLYHSIFQQWYGPYEPTLMTSNKLQSEPAFLHWLEKLDRGVLFLSGKNAAWINQTTLNWLSQAAVLAVERLADENRDMAYVLCQTKYAMKQTEKPLAKSVLAQLALQLIDRRPSDLQHVESEIDAILYAKGWEDENEDRTIQAGVKIINEALKAYRFDETVFLVIDRIDQCQWTYETERLRQGVLDVLDCLLQLVLDAPCRVKVLVVSASTSHGYDLRQSLAGRHKPASMELFVHRANWDQD